MADGAARLRRGPGAPAAPPVRRGRLGLLLLVLSVASGCGGEDPHAPPLGVREAGGRIEVSVAGRRGARLGLVASRPWRGQDPLVAGLPSLRIWHDALTPSERERSTLAEATLEPGRRLDFVLPLDRLAGFEDPVALQVLATRTDPADGPYLTMSEAFVVERRESGPAVRSYAAWACDITIGPLVLGVVPCAVLLVVLVRRRLPRLPRWTAAVLLGALAVGGARSRPDPSEHPRSVAAGYAAPPLRPDRLADAVEGDALERWYGPGLRALAAAARRARRGDERVAIVFPGPTSSAWQTAAHLERLVPGASVVRAGRDSAPKGLTLFLDVAPEGVTLLATPAGTLARVDGG